MAITSALCNSYTQEILSGTHSSGDAYYIALYTSSATLSASTTVYSSTNEVVGTGYTAGGKVLVGFNTVLDTGVAVLDWSTDPSWTSSTITARGALIYNGSKSNKAVCTIDFGADISSTNGTFIVEFPAATATLGLVRIS